MSLRIGIALGDVTGIGPEVTLKALAEETRAGDARYVVIGSAAWLARANVQLGTGLAFVPWGGQSDSPLCVADPGPALPSALQPGAPEAALAAVAWLTEGAACCLRGELDALVTAPVSKAAILRAGVPFVGQTEHLARLAAAQRTAMMLLGEDDRRRWLRVVLATTHLPIRDVARELSAPKVQQAVELAADACRRLALPRARIAVCGLNPHAGESGHLGDEEGRLIIPALEAARHRGIEVTGPLAADTLFYHALRGHYDVVVAMYHDQGLAPLKLVAFETGVNWTLGLPFVRTSPDHGPAYDLAGQGVASASSMRAAIRLARQLGRRPG